MEKSSFHRLRYYATLLAVVSGLGFGPVSCQDKQPASAAPTSSSSPTPSPTASPTPSATPTSSPTISSINPTSGSTAGGTSIVFTGTEFASGLTAYVNGVACALTTFNSSTSVTCVTAAASAGGPYSVSVINTDSGTGSLANTYTYLAPSSVNGDCRSSSYGSGVSVISISDVGEPGYTGLLYVDIPYTPVANVSATSATLALSSGYCQSYDGNAATLYLYSDSGGQPDNVMADLANLSCTTLLTSDNSPAPFTFAFSGQALTGGTTYHFVLAVGDLGEPSNEVALDIYPTAPANCSGSATGTIIEDVSASWVNESGSSVGILGINE